MGRKRPEFLVRGNGIEFYLEAKEVTTRTDVERAAENRSSTLYDQLNRIDTPNFLFQVRNIIFKSSSQPSGRRIIRFLEETLPQYDPDLVEKELQKFGMVAIPDLTYEDENLKLDISLMPKSRDEMV